MKKIWPFSFNVLYFAALSTVLPFFVLFYQQLGFSGAQIGLLTGEPPLVSLVASPFWTSLADTKRWHKPVMGLGIAMAAICIFLFQTFNSFAMIFGLILMYNLFLSPVTALADSATINMLGDERAMYGRIRLGGTLGWGLFAPVAGALVQNYGLRAGFLSFSIIMLINLFVSQKFVHRSHEEETPSSGSVRTFLTNRRWIRFLFLVLLGSIGSLSVSTFLFPYMAEMGARETTMGFALTISTLTELPIFFFGDRLVKRFGSYGLLLMALVLIGIRSFFYAAARTPGTVLILQAFSGTLFPAMWLAGVTYADENAPAGLKSSAQGLFTAVAFSVGGAVGGFLGALLLESIGGHGMYLVFGTIILVGVAIAEGSRRLFPETPERTDAVAASSDK